LITSCTKNDLPKLTTDSISEINQISAKITGTIKEEGESKIIIKGFCWSIFPNPTIDDSKTTNGFEMGQYTGILTGLSTNTKYYVRAYATNSNGTSYGNELNFTTSVGLIVDSRDGNIYKIITIGTQTWMAENLKATKYNDGTDISLVLGQMEWTNLSTPGYCYYLNDYNTYGSTYGCLYNWQAVNTGKLCPEGWHAPSKNEFVTLIDHLGGEQIAGGKLKTTGTIQWIYPNEGATNESGFSALPAGYRNFEGGFGYNGMYGNFWSSTDGIPNHAYHIYVGAQHTIVFLNPAYKEMGLSVRCIKN
jgi:uncharacterized protein (TIGR02145 family)